MEDEYSWEGIRLCDSATLTSPIILPKENSGAITKLTGSDEAI
jgi:hypothetical protein